jgi:hypothetical protein
MWSVSPSELMISIFTLLVATIKPSCSGRETEEGMKVQLRFEACLLENKHSSWVQLYIEIGLKLN